MKRLAVAMLAVMGLGATHGAQVARQSTEVRQMAAVKNGGTTRAIEADMFGRYLRGIAGAAVRRGCSPKEWGMSQDCRRMVRKSRLRSLGLGGDHI